MEIVREKLFRYLGEELPYAMNVEVEQFEEEESGLFRIYIAVLVDKDSQKAILIGKGGEKLKKISTEARLDMEKIVWYQSLLEDLGESKIRLGRRYSFPARIRFMI